MRKGGVVYFMTVQEYRGYPARINCDHMDYYMARRFVIFCFITICAHFEHEIVPQPTEPTTKVRVAMTFEERKSLACPSQSSTYRVAISLQGLPVVSWLQNHPCPQQQSQPRRWRTLIDPQMNVLGFHTQPAPGTRRTIPWKAGTISGSC